MFIALNLSPVQFRTGGFAERLIAIVAAEGADPNSLELEITESVLMQNDDVIAALAVLRKAGFRIALDGFGTGYSSLSYLRRFEVDKIKIDRSFVQNLGAVDAAAIVTAVVTLGHAMGLEVTAAGSRPTTRALSSPPRAATCCRATSSPARCRSGSLDPDPPRGAAFSRGLRARSAKSDTINTGYAGLQRRRINTPP